jgi:hypothetical protein
MHLCFAAGCDDDDNGTKGGDSYIKMSDGGDDSYIKMSDGGGSDDGP